MFIIVIWILKVYFNFFLNSYTRADVTLVNVIYFSVFRASPVAAAATAAEREGRKALVSPVP